MKRQRRNDGKTQKMRMMELREQTLRCRRERELAKEAQDGSALVKDNPPERHGGPPSLAVRLQGRIAPALKVLYR